MPGLGWIMSDSGIFTTCQANPRNECSNSILSYWLCPIQNFESRCVTYKMRLFHLRMPFVLDIQIIQKDEIRTFQLVRSLLIHLPFLLFSIFNLLLTNWKTSTSYHIRVFAQCWCFIYVLHTRAPIKAFPRI